MMQAKEAAEQPKDNQNGTGAVRKGNFAADILEDAGFCSQISAIYKDFNIRGKIERQTRRTSRLTFWKPLTT